ncbi:MAG: hypothetical protein ACOC7Y_02080 [Chloroflexota bacterium]
MEIWPSYVVLVIGAAIAGVLLLHNARLALRFLLTMVKVGGLLCVLGVIGWLVGWWDLPRPIAILLYGLGRLWRPFTGYLLDWLRSCLP